MTLVEDYSREAAAEVLAIFRETHRRMGEFQVTNKGITRIPEERFGFSSQGAGFLYRHVEEILLRNGVLTVWDSSVSSNMRRTVYTYQVNSKALLAEEFNCLSSR